ncbi:MAG: HmuY family protein, partial [Candidatus Thermoplasmatota archaeon]|nr:HmuY family protein [Candidatus Thermoplasmatota archaeon]
MNRKYVVLAILMAAILGGVYWYHLVASFESSVGTNNSFVAHDNEEILSNETDDSLLSLEFDSGTDNLQWSFTTIMLGDGQSQFDCTLGGLSSKAQVDGKVQTNLNADGRTFTVSIDATSEETYTGFSLSSMSESTNENFSLRFSKTDIYLGEDISWLKVDDTDFNQLTAPPSDNFSNDTSERLDWYDYDLSVHRVEPKDRIFLLNDGDFTYKVQFINYYNDNDESRHIT